MVLLAHFNKLSVLLYAGFFPRRVIFHPVHTNNKFPLLSGLTSSMIRSPLSLLFFLLPDADIVCLLLFLAFLGGWGAVGYIGIRSLENHHQLEIILHNEHHEQIFTIYLKILHSKSKFAEKPLIY